MNNNKGISAIVATVLIILITVAAVTIIWAAIIPMVSTNLEKGQVCLDAASGGVQIIDDGFTCKNLTATPDYLSLQIKHGSKDFNLDEIQVIVSGGGNSNTLNLAAATGATLPGINEERTFSVPESSMGSLTVPQLDEVSIAPIVKVGGRATETCDVVQTLKLTDC